MILSKPNHIKIYGHRGARGDLPENTLESFKYLFDNSISAFETDILISKEGRKETVNKLRDELKKAKSLNEEPCPIIREMDEKTLKTIINKLLYNKKYIK